MFGGSVWASKKSPKSDLFSKIGDAVPLIEAFSYLFLWFPNPVYTHYDPKYPMLKKHNWSQTHKPPLRTSYNTLNTPKMT